MSTGVFSEMSRLIEALGKEKGIDKNIVINAVTQGMLAAAIKKYGTYREIEAQYNEELGEVELFEFKEVVKDEDFIDEEVEITLTEAEELDPGVAVGDSVGVRMEAKDLGRIAAQLARQIITQQVRDAEREIIFSEFEQRKGEIASGIARRVERRAIVVDLGRTEAYIPPREQIPGESFRPGDRVQGFITEVRQTTRGPQIIMSRAHGEYLMKLFEAEVPEIEDGIIKLIGAAREPGQRAKMAVSTSDPAVDPVGACVGVKGSRVQNVVQELRGEKIDIVPYDEDPVAFVCNALQPAEISKVFMDEDNREMEVVVPDNQLSLAIGKKGQNVRLAAKLTGWKLDILGESDAAARTAQSIFNLMHLPGMTETMAQSIFQSGFGSIQAIADAEVEVLQVIPGYEESEKADDLRISAVEVLEKFAKEGKSIPEAPQVQDKESKVSGGDAMSAAEARLKEELAQLKGSEETSDAESKEAADNEDKTEEQAALEEDKKQEELSEPEQATESADVIAVENGDDKTKTEEKH